MSGSVPTVEAFRTEFLSRGYVSVDSFPIPRPDRQAPDEVRPEAFISWGGISSFDVEDFRNDAKDPTPEDKEPPFIPLEGDYYEEGRTWENVKIVNPENEEQFVKIPKTDLVAFTAPARYVIDPNAEALRHAKDSKIQMKDQVTFSFSSTYDDHGEPPPVYLKNSDGQEFQPYVLTPFQSIREVSWPSKDFILITLIAWPEVQVGIPPTGVDPSDGIVIELTNPANHRDIRANYRDQVAFDNDDPDHPPPPLKERYLAVPIAGSLPTPRFTPFGGFGFFQFFVNISLIAKDFRGELAAQTSEGTPNPPVLVIKYGGIGPFVHHDNAGRAAFAKIRWEYIKGAGIKSVETANNDITERLQPFVDRMEVGGGAPSMAEMLEALAFQDTENLIASYTMNAITPRSFWGGHYNFTFDYDKRKDKFNYPPSGAVPEFSSNA